MGKIVSRQAPELQLPQIDLLEVVGQVLPRGHVIHGYSSALSERVIKILKTRRYSDSAPLLGFGVDGQAEQALGRALLTYAMRERDGLDSIRANQYPEIDEGQLPMGYHNSRFDNIVWGGDFTLYQDGEVVVAESAYGGEYGLSPLQVTADTALGAITALADSYYFLNGSVRERMSKLPPIALGE